MGNRLKEKKVAFLATDGFEQVELTEPWETFTKEGARCILVSPESDSIQGFHHKDKGDSFKVSQGVEETKVEEFDALVLPGGVHNPDALRENKDAVSLVRRFAEQSKPIAAICHGPWMLVEADLVRDKTVTSWPSLRTDIENAGGNWVDESVHEDGGIITSRKPDDLSAFCERAIQAIVS